MILKLMQIFITFLYLTLYHTLFITFLHLTYVKGLCSIVLVILLQNLIR